MQGKYAAVRQVIRQTYPCSMRTLGAEEPESDMIGFLEVAPGGELEDDKDRRLYLCGKWGVCVCVGDRPFYSSRPETPFHGHGAATTLVRLNTQNRSAIAYNYIIIKSIRESTPKRLSIRCTGRLRPKPL